MIRTENELEQCPLCWGRGYRPEKRRASKRNPLGLGFYARTCQGCNGLGHRFPKNSELKSVTEVI